MADEKDPFDTEPQKKTLPGTQTDEDKFRIRRMYQQLQDLLNEERGLKEQQHNPNLTPEEKGALSAEMVRVVGEIIETCALFYNAQNVTSQPDVPPTIMLPETSGVIDPMAVFPEGSGARPKTKQDQKSGEDECDASQDQERQAREESSQHQTAQSAQSPLTSKGNVQSEQQMDINQSSESAPEQAIEPETSPENEYIENTDKSVKSELRSKNNKNLWQKTLGKIPKLILIKKVKEKLQNQKEKKPEVTEKAKRKQGTTYKIIKSRFSFLKRKQKTSQTGIEDDPTIKVSAVQPQPPPEPARNTTSDENDPDRIEELNDENLGRIPQMTADERLQHFMHITEPDTQQPQETDEAEQVVERNEEEEYEDEDDSLRVHFEDEDFDDGGAVAPVDHQGSAAAGVSPNQEHVRTSGKPTKTLFIPLKPGAFQFGETEPRRHSESHLSRLQGDYESRLRNLQYAAATRSDGPMQSRVLQEDVVRTSSDPIGTNVTVVHPDGSEMIVKYSDVDYLRTYALDAIMEESDDEVRELLQIRIRRKKRKNKRPDEFELRDTFLSEIFEEERVPYIAVQPEQRSNEGGPQVVHVEVHRTLDMDDDQEIATEGVSAAAETEENPEYYISVVPEVEVGQSTSQESEPEPEETSVILTDDTLNEETGSISNLQRHKLEKRSRSKLAVKLDGTLKKFNENFPIEFRQYRKKKNIVSHFHDTVLFRNGNIYTRHIVQEGRVS